MNATRGTSGPEHSILAPASRSAPSTLDLTLRSACATLGIDFANALIASAGRARFARFHASPGNHSPAASDDLPVFCLVKILTAAVIHILAADGRLCFEDTLLSLLPRVGKSPQWPEDILQGVSIEQLLAHSH